MTDLVLLTPTEMAAQLRVSKVTIYRLLNDGKIPCYRIGRSFRVEESAFINWIKRQGYEG